MALPTSPDSISLNQVNTELGINSTNTISLNDAAVRTLAGVGGSGTTISMSDLRGKSNAQTYTFAYTGGNQTFTVPSGKTSMVVKLWGAGGGAGFLSYGGGGGFAQSTVSVSGGQAYTIAVGGGGAGWNNGSANGFPDAYGTSNIGTAGGGGSTSVTGNGAAIYAPGGGGGGDTNGHGANAGGAGGGLFFDGSARGDGTTNGGEQGFRFAGGGSGGQFRFTSGSSNTSATGTHKAYGPPGGSGDANYPGYPRGYGGDYNGQSAPGGGWAVIIC